jgi:hypothetical protein
VLSDEEVSVVEALNKSVESNDEDIELGNAGEINLETDGDIVNVEE